MKDGTEVRLRTKDPKEPLNGKTGVIVGKGLIGFAVRINGDKTNSILNFAPTEVEPLQETQS